ncbi:hypothetical protein Tco_0121325 [Tanacetum coccineum]
MCGSHRQLSEPKNEAWYVSWNKTEEYTKIWSLKVHLKKSGVQMEQNQVKQKEDGIFIRQDKYVTKILKKFGFSDGKTASTPMETHKPLLKDADGEDVDEHLYRSMIGSLKYLKGQPKLGLWYHKNSPFDLVVYTDSDYVGASLDRKSTTRGCQFLGCRLISWQCKKQIITNIHIDNESTICIVKNPVLHSKTKHIEIRHHFIKDSNEKRLIQMIKIHTDQNVADLLTKAFDVSRFQYLIDDWNEMQKLLRMKLELKLITVGVTTAEDFLNAHPIGYALTVNPTIYVSYIEQFWSTAKAKTINEETQIHATVDGLMMLNYTDGLLLLAVEVNAEVQLQALVDKKKLIITEYTIRRDLQLEDANGVDCLPNAAIFEQLTLMGYEKLS